MKNKKRLFLLLVLSSLGLASCGGGAGSSSSSSSSSSSASASSSSSSSSASSSSSSSSSSSLADNVITNKDLSRGITTYKDIKGETTDLNRSSIYKTAGYPHVANTKKQHLFVAPFAFIKDPDDGNDRVEANDALLEKINITFSADDAKTKEVGGYISVSSFYQRSSFGISDFTATVMPTWIQYPGTPSQFQAKASSNGGVVAAEYSRSWYVAEYAKTDHGALGADAEPITYFDADNDGFIDLMWVVYAYPYKDTAFWWAYVTYTGNAASISSPTVQTLGFASTTFMTQNFNGYDSHTFIHETGHTFGLDDYYDYSNTWAPMAGVDYMDHNLGDHNSYSKFSLGWVSPYVIKEEDLEGEKNTAIITLNAATTSGDCLVLASPDYNGTAFDEMFMVELVGPTGLAEQDYKNGYENTSGFTQPGIRILHADGRVYANDHDTYLQDVDEIGQKGRDVRLGNTYGGRSGVKVDSDFWTLSDAKSTKRYYSELSIMESTVGETNWTMSNTYNATNDSLFHKNARFYLGENSPWSKTFMPSQTNLWNKAKTTTGWNGTSQTFTINPNMTCNFSLRVLSIDEDPTYGYTSKVRITLQ